MSISEQAKEIYDRELRQQLESSQFGMYVAIEPESKDHFVADSFVAAALAAKELHPAKKSFVIRIGHDAAFHIGANWS